VSKSGLSAMSGGEGGTIDLDDVELTWMHERDVRDEAIVASWLKRLKQYDVYFSGHSRSKGRRAVADPQFPGRAPAEGDPRHPPPRARGRHRSGDPQPLRPRPEIGPAPGPVTADQRKSAWAYHVR
jgi:hypothetical protein